MNAKIVCVVPTIRPERMAEFRNAWRHLFAKHNVVLATVFDGDELYVTEQWPYDEIPHPARFAIDEHHVDLFCRHTDACRNLGFAAAVTMGADYVLTLDDDVAPIDKGFSRHAPGMPDYEPNTNDPIQQHLDVLNRRVPISWMNTAHADSEYLRGMPYNVRAECPAMMSHGVWVGTPDFDGQTQLRLEAASSTQCDKCEGSGEADSSRDDAHKPCPKCGGSCFVGSLPHSLPYYVGPIPRGVLAPISGMNVMVRREALPYFYFAPMGKDSGVLCLKCVGEGGIPDVPGFACVGCGGSGSSLHRFADIFMGIHVKRVFDRLNWAIYTGASVVHHTRASDARRNVEQERLGMSWNEHLWKLESGDAELPLPDGLYDYWELWKDRRRRYAGLIQSMIGETVNGV